MEHRLCLELMAIEQGKNEPICAYSERFSSIITELCEPLENLHLLTIFHEGMLPVMRTHYGTATLSNRPANITDAFKLALYVEAAIGIGDFQFRSKTAENVPFIAKNSPQPSNLHSKFEHKQQHQYRCTNCRKDNHTTQECTKLRGSKGKEAITSLPQSKMVLGKPLASGISATCFKCNQVGHYANKCPQQGRASSTQSTSSNLAAWIAAVQDNALQSLSVSTSSSSTCNKSKDFIHQKLQHSSSSNADIDDAWLLDQHGALPNKNSGSPQNFMLRSAHPDTNSSSAAAFDSMPPGQRQEVLAPTLCAGKWVLALVDSGCTNTLISPLLASSLGLVVKPVTGVIALGIKGATAPSLGQSICSSIAHGQHSCIDAPVEIADLPHLHVCIFVPFLSL